MPPSPGSTEATGAGGSPRIPEPRSPHTLAHAVVEPFVPMQTTGRGGAHRRPEPLEPETWEQAAHRAPEPVQSTWEEAARRGPEPVQTTWEQAARRGPEPVQTTWKQAAHRTPEPVEPAAPVRAAMSRGAHRMPAASAPVLVTGSGGAHRTDDPTFRRNVLVVGGAAVLAGQMAFSHMQDPSMPLLPDTSGLFGQAGESTITELAATGPIAALPSTHDAFEPVTLDTRTAELEQADAAQLAKAAGLAEAAAAAQAEAARQAEQARIAAADSPSVRGKACPPNTAGLRGVKPWVSTAGVELRCIFNVGTLGGLGSRANYSDHPRGKAIDFMTAGGVNGDQLADYALKYKDELRIKYVIWKQRINFGNGWKGMENRGSITANHFDHVHISFL
jgi:hypothetical protein